MEEIGEPSEDPPALNSPIEPVHHDTPNTSTKNKDPIYILSEEDSEEETSNSSNQDKPQKSADISSKIYPEKFFDKLQLMERSLKELLIKEGNPNSRQGEFTKRRILNIHYTMLVNKIIRDSFLEYDSYSEGARKRMVEVLIPEYRGLAISRCKKLVERFSDLERRELEFRKAKIALYRDRISGKPQGIEGRKRVKRS